MARSSKPSVYSYDDFRDYLSAYFSYRQQENSRFSLRSFAKTAGLSDNYPHLVLSKKRNLSQQSLRKFIDALKLNRQEASFFESLVFYSQSKNSAEKRYYYERMLKSSRYREIKQLDSEKYEYFSKWYFAAIRELFDTSVTEDPKWIAKQLTPSISEQQAKEALQKLESLGLLKRDKNGKLRNTNESIRSAPQVKSVALSSFHKELLQLASESIERIPADQRELSATILALSDADLLEIKERIRRFQAEVLQEFGQRNSKKQRVYEIGLQIFPLSKGGPQ